MDQEQLKKLLAGVKDGEIGIDAALERMRHMPFEDLGFAKIDHHRALRQGFAEVVLCEGKTAAQVAEIMARLCADGTPILATRAAAQTYDAVRARVPATRYNALASTLTTAQLTICTLAEGWMARPALSACWCGNCCASESSLRERAIVGF